MREIHVAGPHLVPGLALRDRHCSLQEEDYALLAWLRERAAPMIVTLEYGDMGANADDPERNDPRALEAQLVRLRGILGKP